MSIKVITDSTSYLPKLIREDFDISVVSLSINFESETFLEEEIDNASFYNKMEKSKTIPVSSQPNVQAMYTAFEKHVSKGNSVVGIFISSEMSGTYSTALTVKNMILENYPEAVIEIIDSRSNCMQLGFAVLAAAKAAYSGKSLEQVLNSTYAVIKRSRFLFIPHTLDYLKKGGRIGGASHLLGTILQIKPILTVIDGKTEVFDKVRTSERAIKEILKVFFRDIKEKGLVDVAVHHINYELGGTKLAQLIREKLEAEVPVYSIGPVIGAHVGPGTIGIVYHTREEL